MSAARRHALPAILLAAAAGLVLGAFWLLGTSGGARWLIEAAVRRAPVRIEVGSVTGRLLDELRVEGIDARWPTGEAAIETLLLRWRPFSLLGGKISVAGLSLEGARVNLLAPERDAARVPSADLRWPSVAGLPARIEAEVESLRLSRLTIRRAGEERIAVDEVAARVDWSDGFLVVSDLSAKAAGARITGSLAAGFTRPSFRVDAALHRVDLFPWTGTPTEISGSLRGAGGPGGYEGSFALENSGPGAREVRLSGAVSGDLRGVAISGIKGAWLGGVVEGTLEMAWTEGIAVAGSLTGRDLDPARITPEWPGRIRFSARGSVRKTGEIPLAAEVDARLLSSTLRNRALTGELRARLDEEGLRIARMELHGRGFDVSAKGRLEERIAFSADIRDLGGFVPGTKGNGLAEGWLRWRDRSLEGFLAARGRGLAVSDVRVGSFSLSASRSGKDLPFAVHADARGISRGAVRLDSLSLAADGTPTSHSARLSLRSGSGDAGFAARGGYLSGRWEGTVDTLSVREKGAGTWTLAAPVDLAVSPRMLKVSPFQAAGPRGESVRGSADLAFEPLRGSAAAAWDNVDPARADPWLDGARLSGNSSGSADIRWGEAGQVRLALRVDASGKLHMGDLALEVPRAHAAVQGNDGGIRASVELAVGSGGTVAGSFLSDRPAKAAIPERGTVRLAWRSVDLALASPWIPEGMKLAGTVGGRADGELLPGGRFALEGAAQVASGAMRWKTQGGEVNAALRSADLSWTWQGGYAGGEVALVLEEYGNVRAKFRVPLPAQVPLAVRPEGEVEGALNATLRENGLLPAFLPGMLQETSAKIDVVLRVGGAWRSPEIDGAVELSQAGAFLPATGVRLQELEIKAKLDGQAIRIEALRVRSGKGTLEGTATINLENWRLAGYKASVTGKDFRAVDLPEFRMTANPDVSVEGTARRAAVRGEILVPELLVFGRQTPPPVPRSEDVVIVDAKKTPAKDSPLSLDVLVKVVLGKRVLVKAEGIDARLEGNVTVQSGDGNDYFARGEIRVAEGSYAVYGIRLQIARGGLLFADAPVDRPTLDVLAIRTVGEVKAGVEVAGTLNRPLVKLHSEPPMADTDVLSYIVLGHPLGQRKEQAEPLMLAAGALLPMGQSAMLQDRIKRHFGFDVLEVKAAGGEAAGAAVTVGKYLNPRLYVSYGRSLFTKADEVAVRYDLGKKWQVQSQLGEESGVDLFYKIEFR